MAIRAASVHGLNLNFHTDNIVSITVFNGKQLEFTFKDGSQHLYTKQEPRQRVTILKSADFGDLMGRLDPSKTVYI